MATYGTLNSSGLLLHSAVCAGLFLTYMSLFLFRFTVTERVLCRLKHHMISSPPRPRPHYLRRPASYTSWVCRQQQQRVQAFPNHRLILAGFSAREHLPAAAGNHQSVEIKPVHSSWRLWNQSMELKVAPTVFFLLSNPQADNLYMFNRATSKFVWNLNSAHVCPEDHTDQNHGTDTACSWK